jgi:outer membrane autotransporter protein
MSSRRSGNLKLGAIAYTLSGMLFTQGAWAHTNSVGYENAGPGSVNFWYGNWHSGTTFTEGSMQLVGPGGFNVTSPFTTVVNTKPAGLIDGVTNFYSDGTQLVGTPTGSTFSWQGVNFTGLSAGNYTFTYIPIANPTLEWNPADSIILSSTVTLSAAVLGGSGFVPNSTSTSLGAATVLDAISGSASGDMATIIAALQAMDAATQTAALQRIAPNSGAALGMSSSQVVTGVLDAVSVRLDGIRTQGYTTSMWDDLNNGGKIMLAASGESSGLLSSDPSLKHSLWVKAFGARGDQDLMDAFAGYKAETGGMAIGSDMMLPSQWVVGGAFTWAATDVSMADYRSGDGAKIDSYQLTAYATRDFGRWYAEGMLAYAIQNYETSRITGMSGIAQGDFDGSQVAARVTAGMPLAIGHDLTLIPLAGLEWDHIKQDAYTETGAGALSMNIAEASADRVRSLVGAKLESRREIAGYQVKPSVQVGWRHEFDNDGINTTSTFTGGGGAFTTVGQDLPEDRFHLGFGVAVSKTNRALVSLQLDTEQASGYSAYAGQVVGQWKF